MRRIPACLPVLALLLPLLPALAGCQKLQARMELKKGNELYRDEIYKEALEQFQKGLQIDPTAKFAWRSVGLSAMALFRPGVDDPENKKHAEIAIDAFKKYLQAFPADQKVEEYLVTTLINSGKYDEALQMLKEEAQRTNKQEMHQMVVSTMIKSGKLEDAFEWTQRHAARDPQVLYSIAVACWAQSYNDPMLSVEQRTQIVDTGLDAAKRAIEIKPDYFEAMAYYNLLFREKAKLETDPLKAQEYYAQAEEWVQKALAVRERQKVQETKKAKAS